MPAATSVGPVSPSLACAAMLRSILVGTGPYFSAASPDGNWLAIVLGMGSSNQVQLVNTRTNTLVHSYTVGNGVRQLAWTPDSTTILVCNSTDNTVSKITIATNTVSAPIAVGTDPYAVCITPDGTSAYVACYMSNTVTKITIATNATAAITTPQSVGANILATPDGTAIFLLSHGNYLMKIVVATSAVTAIALPNTPLGLGITSDGATVWITEGADFQPYTVATSTLGAAIPNGGDGETSGTFITADNAYVCCNDFTGSKFIIMKIAGSVVSPVNTGSLPNSAAISNAGLAYTANAGSGTVTVINIAAASVVRTLTVSTEPAYCAYDPATDRVYVSNTGSDTITAIAA